MVLGDLGRYQEAEAVLDEVVAAEARHADAYNSLGFVCSKQQKMIRPSGMTSRQHKFDRIWLKLAITSTRVCYELASLPCGHSVRVLRERLQHDGDTEVVVDRLIWVITVHISGANLANAKR